MQILIEFKWPLTVFLLLIIFFWIFRKEIAEFLREIGWLKTKWFELRRIRKEIFAKADQVEQLSKKINQDKKELRKSIRTFIETLYLVLSTRHKFPIPTNVSEQITQNLNKLANLAIKNKSEENEWKRRMDEINKLLEQEGK